MSESNSWEKVKEILIGIVVVIGLWVFFYFKYLNVNPNNPLNTMQANPYTVSIFLSTLWDEVVEKLDQWSLEPTCKHTLSIVSSWKEKVQTNDIMDMMEGKTEWISKDVVEYAWNCASKIISQFSSFASEQDFSESTLMGKVLLGKCENITIPGAPQEQVYSMQYMCMGIGEKWSAKSSNSFQKCKNYINKNQIEISIIQECNKKFLSYMFELEKSYE